MTRINNLSFFLLSLSTLFLLSKCSFPGSTVPPAVPIPDSLLPGEHASSLFITDPQTKEVTFSFNSTSTALTGGATYWTEISPVSDTFKPIELTLRKTSGFSSGGYGIFFSQREADSDQFSCLVIFINIEGEYCTGVVSDRYFTFIRPWSSGEFLVKGYGQKNTLTIQSGSEPGKYKLFLNGNLTDTFKDPSPTLHSNGGHGCITVVTPLENFPSQPVTVIYGSDTL